jgi:hypothetical protein
MEGYGGGNIMDGIEGEGQDSFGLLDLLVLIAQDLRLLIGLPIAVGVVAYAATFLIPHGYVSHAILALPADLSVANGLTPAVPTSQTPVQAAALMVSPVVLDPVIDSLGFANDRPVPVVRMSLAEDVDAKVGTDGFLHLSVTRKDPAESLAISNAIIDGWLKTTVPVESERKELAERLAFSRESLQSVEQSLKELTSKGGASLDKSKPSIEAGVMIVTLGQLQAKYLNDVLFLPKLMGGLSRDVVRQAPALVADGAKPMRGLIAASVALSAGAILLAWVFVRLAWRRASKDPRSAVKQEMLMAALRFRRAGP